ncbi:right-handed parallel beta-helix repeat-containing protein [uncultured Gimesia sp.]|uniref:right-handed parallel beta-helix repeat-containing protein n=1 Tax=uncultured Gimesia sp. TaxID=1678688 RepID=UPI00260775D3|nr:right-handed parallel beta-helix repeat-containing protein [uncultured Gimesia sp.]
MRNAVRFVEMKSAMLCLIFLFCELPLADCGVIYVDNRAGNNALNGIAPKIVGGKNGPVKTIKRAISYAKPGDKIVLINNETPYYESISLSGRRLSGVGKEKFTILGNGATISGAIPIPMNGWRQQRNGLWKVTPYRKGFFNLYLDGKSLPEHQPEKGKPVKLEDIPSGKWAVYQGAIYYHSLKNQSPPVETFSLAGKSVGLSLVDVNDVYISDLTFENFRQDGINIHDRCKGVVLENVTCSGNGRSGLSVNGTSQVEVIDSKLTDNRIDDLSVTEHGAANLKNTKLGKKASVLP